ncbi:MAG: hypothetical protein GYA60_01250, partial [Candidatus Methanofastidiosa archaeon]|nr:hypothetical protein [Candidatus Methanofastidiosa archaeon]
MGLPGIKNLKYYILALFLIIILSISLTFPLYGRFPFPLSWDIWYHMRIVENFSNGNYFFDPVSFGPEGRIHTYPPLFHIIFLVFYKILNIAGLSLMDTARLMPTLLLSLSAISIFLLINKFYGMEIGFMTSFFVLVIPVSLDRGIITSPQSLAFILIPLGFLTYLIGLNEKKYLYISGIISSAIFYTHGLSFIVFYLSLIFFTIIDYLSIKKIRVSNLLFLSIITIVLSLPLIIHLALNGIASNIPYGGIFKISFYPVKLGYITMALAIPGALLLVLRKKEEDLMLLSWGFMAFMLSRNYITGLDLLPFRFIEFLAYPLAFYSSFAIYE